MALTKIYEDRGLNVKYLCFDDSQPPELIKGLKLPTLDLTLETSVPIYLEMKLKSRNIANWIASSRFFKSIFNILPSLGNMVYLGHLVDMLEKNPSLHVVVDSPSSGHAMAMFQATDLWYEIFQHGLLAKDITRMKNFFSGQNNFAITVVSLPTEMSLQESLELTNQIRKSQPNYAIDQVTNNVLSLNEIVKTHELPDFIEKKTLIEQQLLADITYPLQMIPHYSKNHMQEIITDIVKSHGRQ